jgi:hypothetical protein
MKVFYKTIIFVEAVLEFICKMGFKISCVFYNIGSIYYSDADRVNITNGNKTAVMKVIWFLCVSLGSSTVQLHDSLGSRRASSCSEAGLSSQHGDGAGGVYYQRVGFYAVFVGKRIKCEGYSQKMVSDYGRKGLSRKAVHNWAEKFSQESSKVADDARPGAEVAETIFKRLLCCGFRRTGKAIGQVFQCL